MGNLKFLLVLIMMPVLLAAQDSVRYRLIFIGEQSEKISADMWMQATSHIISDKTTFVFLDANKYLRGTTKEGSKEQRVARDILRSQYEMIRARGASAYYIQGGSEWNNITFPGMGQTAGKVQETADSLFRIAPGSKCADPIALDINDRMTIIFFNSDWWLDPIPGAPATDDCDCKTRADVLDRLDELRYKNRDKHLIVVSRHPFKSYGVYGSKSTWKDHLFPLTAVHRQLYIPMPGIGSAYRFFRSGFAGPGNSRHPLYKDMIDGVEDVLHDFPNLVHVSGHEKGLQMTIDKYVQVVSGPGAKHKSPRRGRYSSFADTHAGFVIADLYDDDSLRFVFFVDDNDYQPEFKQTIAYQMVSMNDSLAGNLIAGDSILVQVHPSYDKAGKFHRFLFGENYRKEWAAVVKLPVFRISQLEGGLQPLKRGGGMQSKSLRLADKDGREWVLRSVEKSPDALLPDNLRQTFARNWVDDATSAQHPFGALVVPPVANALKVPHSTPKIGVVAPDTTLGIHSRVFANMVALFEEREPLGDSDNSEKMKKNLQADNDNSINASEFLNARMLDMLLGDWDRHEDQWRWKDMAKGKVKTYLGVPRDRDQVFHLTQGLIPGLAAKDYLLPTLRSFDHNIEKVQWVLFKTRFVNAYPEFQLSEDAWMSAATAFKTIVTDSVLEAALQRLPPSVYHLRHDVLLKKLVARRDRIPVAMNKYYRFIQKIADIQTSDKNEWVQVSDAPNGGLNVRIARINKHGRVEDELMNKDFLPGLTKEIRIYTRDGNDSITLNNNNSTIRLRFIGGKDRKVYHVQAAKRKVHIYNMPGQSAYRGNMSGIKKHISNDSLNTAYIPVNLYNVWMPLVVAGLNIDDGFIVGAGFKFTRQEGFRKIPYTYTQQLLVRYAFATGAYRIKYDGEWKELFGKADFTLQAIARAPNNTVNFFGRGNNTGFDKTGDYKRFYRTRYSTYQVDPALRWTSPHASFSVGPSLYYYRFDRDDNKGRFIENTSLIGSYDSNTVEKTKWHAGITTQFVRDKRNNRTFPKWGSYINVRFHVYKGISNEARSFAQLIPELAFYKSLTRRSTIILAERMGGVIGLGHTAFYQSAFIGGHENLLGYRQFRFAGRHSFYNNLELRIKLADVANYIIPGQFGITGFWDIGRVWEKYDNSDKWHNGTGGGIYFAPASVIVLSLVAGYSAEGWYPYFTMGLRF